MNPRKPDSIRTGHRRYPEAPEPTDKAIEPPPMSAGAQIVWARVLPRVQDLKVMTWVDTEALAVLCELLSMHATDPNPKVAAQARMYLSQFGLTPSSRASFAAASGTDGPPDPLSDFDLD